MREPIFNGLYYPQDPHTLAEQARPIQAIHTTVPQAALLPHAAWPYVLPLLHQSLAHLRTLDPALIVLLAPHHGIPKNQTPVVSAALGLCLPHQPVPFAADVCTELIGHFSLQVDETAFDDESSWELLIALLASYHPTVPILPILTGELTGSHKHHLVSLLAEIKRSYPSTLFVVTANTTPPLSSPSAEACARRFVSALEKGGDEPLCCCNRSAVAALTTVLDGQWRVIGQMSGGKTHDEIPSSLDEQEQHVWHIGAILE